MTLYTTTIFLEIYETKFSDTQFVISYRFNLYIQVEAFEEILITL